MKAVGKSLALNFTSSITLNIHARLILMSILTLETESFFVSY